MDNLTPTNIITLAPDTFPKIALFANLVIKDVESGRLDMEEARKKIYGFEKSFELIKEAIK